LAPHPTKTGLVRVETKYGKRARTVFEVQEKFGSWTLLKAVPLTHRLHQIRVHLKRVGLTVAGDEAYGGQALRLSSLKPNYHLKPGHSERPLLDHACLHAERLAMVHPVTGESLNISTPWPKDLLVAIKYLRKYDAV
jgi:23S rRNA-/tRNA-specific pseudouridylate synthase